MVVGIDIDDTLFDTNKVLIEKALYYDKHFLKNKGFKDKDKYMLEEMFYWDREDRCAFIKWMSINGYIFQVPVKDGVSDIIKSWHELGIKIVIITYRKNSDCDNMYEKTAKMLEDNNIYFDKLIIDSGLKGIVCKNEGVDIFIDDSYRHCLDAQSNHIKHILMFETRYNKNFKFNKVSNWQEIDEYVKVIFNERENS